MIKTFKKGSNTKITENFSSSEFDCKCKYSECKQTPIDITHVKDLQVVRSKLKKPMRIHSAYRCERHNREVGGATHSQHPKGTATDFSVRKLSTQDLERECTNFKGVGLYNSFIHVDSREGAKARWDFRKNVKKKI